MGFIVMLRIQVDVLILMNVLQGRGQRRLPQHKVVNRSHNALIPMDRLLVALQVCKMIQMRPIDRFDEFGC